jgi:hypothetical protein
MVQGVIQDMDDFLGHRAVLSPGTLLKLLVQGVGKVLDVESCHGDISQFLQLGGKRRGIQVWEKAEAGATRK